MPVTTQRKSAQADGAAVAPRRPHLRIVKGPKSAPRGGAGADAAAAAKARREAKAAEKAAKSAKLAEDRQEIKQICEQLQLVTKRMPDSYQRWDAIRTRAWVCLLGIIVRAIKAPTVSHLDRLRALKILVNRFERMSQASCGALIDQGAEGIWEGRIP